MLGIDEAKAAANENETLAANEISRMVGDNQQLREAVYASLSRDFGVTMGDPSTILRQFGSVEGVCKQAPYIVSAIRYRMNERDAEAGVVTRMAQRDTIYNMCLVDSEIVGDVEDDVKSGDACAFNKMLEAYIDICFSEGKAANPYSVVLECGKGAFKYFYVWTPENGIKGNPELDEFEFRIDV